MKMTDSDVCKWNLPWSHKTRHTWCIDDAENIDPKKKKRVTKEQSHMVANKVNKTWDGPNGGVDLYHGKENQQHTASTMWSLHASYEFWT